MSMGKVLNFKICSIESILNSLIYTIFMRLEHKFVLIIINSVAMITEYTTFSNWTSSYWWIIFIVKPLVFVVHIHLSMLKLKVNVRSWQPRSFICRQCAWCSFQWDNNKRWPEIVCTNTIFHEDKIIFYDDKVKLFRVCVPTFVLSNMNKTDTFTSASDIERRFWRKKQFFCDFQQNWKVFESELQTQSFTFLKN